MAEVIPSLNTCLNVTKGERKFADCIKQKLDDNYYCWYNVPIGKSSRYPDFIILHPDHGLFVLEVKDWSADNIQERSNKASFRVLCGTEVKEFKNPLEQAHEYALEIVHLLQKDPQLVHIDTRKPLFRWTWGVVLPNITRKQADKLFPEEIIPPHRMICKDDMYDSVDAGIFQELLCGMCSYAQGKLSLPQIDRIRWHIFPEIRLPHRQMALFEQNAEEDEVLPDIMRVMNFQQEQLARSLGEGHRVIHGVAGSGKTLIIGYRAQYLAAVCSKPILILCFNKPLAKKLKFWMQEKGILDKVQVHHFHEWCGEQLTARGIPKPKQGQDAGAYAEELVLKVIDNVDNGRIPSSQYDAVMIDEGNDFESEWFTLITKMVNPRTNSLLVMYDDAQNIYKRKSKLKFTFKSVGIKAQGRTSILQVNYRNTKEMLDYATKFVKDVIKPIDADEDGIPRVKPITAGRRGPAPIEIELPNPPGEAEEIVKVLKEAHAKGTAWKDMAVLFWDKEDAHLLHEEFIGQKIPFIGKDKVTFKKDEDRVKTLTFYSSKGLEFPLVVVMGGRIRKAAETNEDAAQLLYIGLTRSTDQLVVTYH
ncbi:MAG: NERD domain-containing protein [Geobacteraceae bacterium]|nr:NERD domain-containing protein [Geobacteraceae bacterium]